ncbi:MAG: glycosyltransferase family 4 protein [Nitrospiria bacterium]
MKIGIDISPIFYQRGGVGNYTLYLVENLLKIDSNHRFFLFSNQSSKESFSFLGDSKVSFIQGIGPYLRYKIWKEKIDVVHGPNFKLPGKGTRGNLITVHDLALERFPLYGKKTFGSSYSSWKTKKRALTADHIITVSQNSLEDIVNLFGVSKDRVSAIYNGVDRSFFPDRNGEAFLKIKEKYRIKKDQYILFTGTVEPRKNVNTLLKAFSRSKVLREGFSLVLAGGKGWKNENIQSLIQNEGIENELSITGYVAKEELRVLYSFSSCFVFPSVYEGFGMPLLEAMACGAPVVCSNTSSLPEVAGDAAIMVDPFDYEGFSMAIEKIIKDKEFRMNLIRNGLKRVKSFTWEETARQTLQLYEKIYLR